MSVPFDGWVLRKPRISSSNSRFTNEGDVFVRSQDESAYKSAFINNSSAESTEYLVLVEETSDLVVSDNIITETATSINDDNTIFQFNAGGRYIEDVSTGDVTPTPNSVDTDAGIIKYSSDPGTSPTVDYKHKRLEINWTKNDGITRFGYDDKKQRWAPLPGQNPENIGKVGESLSIDVVEGSEPYVVLGSPDSNSGYKVPIPASNRVDDSTFSGFSVPSGEGALNIDTGDIKLASDLQSNYLNQPVYFFRENWFEYDNTDGTVGKVGDSLYLNPIPESNDRPLLRVGNRTYMRIEHSTSSTSPSTGYDAVFNSNTGELNVSSDIQSDLDGHLIFYDGVYKNQTPVSSYSHTDLGTITPDFQQTSGISNIPTSYDFENIILYSKGSGKAISEIEFVESNSDFDNPFEIPPTKAQVVKSTGEIQLSLQWMRDFDNETLTVGTGNFPLENGISFKAKRSLVDQTNERNIPDGKGRTRISDENLTDSILRGPTYSLNQKPLEDISGYDQNQFFKLDEGAKETILEPNKNIIYNFEDDEIQWATTESSTIIIKKPGYEFQIPDQAIHDKGFKLELNEGSGFVEKTPGTDVDVDFGSGTFRFIEEQGDVLYEDVGTIIGSNTLEASTANFSGLTIPSDDVFKPLVIIGENAYRIGSNTSSELTTQKSISESGNVSFKVREAPEIVYKYGFEPVDLSKRIIYPYRVKTLDKAGTNYVPEGEDFDFYQDNTSKNKKVLSSEVLGNVGDTLTIPSYYQNSNANYKIIRENKELTYVAGTPSQDEYSLNGSYEIQFNSSDLTEFDGAQVIFVPELSTNRSTGPVEVLEKSREIGLPDDIKNSNEEISVRVLEYENNYEIQSNILFFDRPFKSGQKLIVEYTDENDQLVEENIGFKFTEDLSYNSNSTTVGFASGKNLDTSRSITPLVNGAPRDLSVDEISKTIDVTQNIRDNRKLQVTYYTLQANGGEKGVTLQNTPKSSDVIFEEGSTQTFEGDHSSRINQDTVIVSNNRSYNVGSVSYDSSKDQTEIQLNPSVPEQQVNPEVLATTSAVIRKSSISNINFEDNSTDNKQITIVGDITDQVRIGQLIYLNDHPYPVENIEWNQKKGITLVSLGTLLTEEYSNPTIKVSDYPVYGPDPTVLSASKIGLLGQDPVIVRFDSQNNGEILRSGEDFTYEPSGRVQLEPTVDPPSKGDVWYLSYTSLKEKKPIEVGATSFYPKVRINYSKQINATNQNNIAGSSLKATYTFRDPDSFYFRVVDLSEYAAEVSDEIEEDTKNLASSSGPLVSSGQSLDLYEKGNESLTWQLGDYRDKDRAARSYIQYYNELAVLFENLLEIIDGRVIGDEDGKFQFDISADGQPGGENPITGDLIDYWANPKDPGDEPTSSEIDSMNLDNQKGYIKNSIDDLVLTSKKPLDITGFPPASNYEFKGTSEQTWKPSKFSRFYPEETKVRTVTAPDDNSDGSYGYFKDKGDLLADLGKDNILSVNNIRIRSAKARVESVDNPGNDPLKIYCGMEFDRDTGEIKNSSYDITTGIPSEKVPPFEVDDHVYIAKVSYTKTTDGFDRTIDVYGENLVVDSVGTDYITVTKNPNSGSHPNLTATDPSTLTGSDLPEKGDTIYTVPPVMTSTGSGFSFQDNTPPYFRPGTDLDVDTSDGELINNTLPDFIAGIMGQAEIKPFTYLDATLKYNNQRTKPYRFPALDGKFVNDDNDNPPPYVQPLPDSELQRLPAEKNEHQNVINNTDEGVVIDGSVPTSGIDNSNAINVSQDLTAISNPPEEYDLLIFEGDTSGGNSVGYDVSSVDSSTIYVGVFDTIETTVSYSIDGSGNYLHTGTGERDSGNAQRWLDASTDFTNFSGTSSQELIVDGNSYVINTLGNGYVDVNSNITTAGPASYEIEASGTGDIGSLRRFDDTSVDFSGASGQLSLSGTVMNDGNYDIAAGNSSGELYLQANIPTGSVTVGVSVGATIVSSTDGAIDSTNNILYTPDPVSNVESNDTLIIHSDQWNGGRYTVDSVVSASPNEIHIKGSFPIDEGSETTPNWIVSWNTIRPRRYSTALTNLQDELVRQRVTYSLNSDAPSDISSLLTATIENPATPYKERLIELRDSLFGTPIATVTGGDVDATSSEFGGINFTGNDVQEDDYILVKSGPNMGFYQITSVTSTDATVNTTNKFTTYSLTNESNEDYEILRGDVFKERTYELVLYETINVLSIIDRINKGIRMTVHNPNDLKGTVGGYEERPGDPLDSTLNSHITAIDNRLNWIKNASPNLRQEIEGVLKGSENLYDIRYAWIDYRINQREGSIPRRNRFEDEISEKREKLRKQLLKTLS